MRGQKDVIGPFAPELRGKEKKHVHADESDESPVAGGSFEFLQQDAIQRPLVN